MGFTIAEKILGLHSTGEPVTAGQVVVAGIDFLMIHDGRALGALAAYKQLERQDLPFASKTALVMDHYTPPPTAHTADIHIAMRSFSKTHGTVLYDENSGISHQLLPENGHVTCGDIVMATDSHASSFGAFNSFGCGIEGTDAVAAMISGKCWFKVPETVKVILNGSLPPGVWAKDITLHLLSIFGVEGCNYKAIEYQGEAVATMGMDDRVTLCNHSAELGAKAALLEADDTTKSWLQAHGACEPHPVSADPDAIYSRKIKIDTPALEPLVARAHQIDQIVKAGEAGGESIQLALIGSCTNGRLSDIRQTAAILEGKKVAPGVRLMVTPASREVYLAAVREGLVETIMEAGGSFASAGCGPCIGISQRYIPGSNERVISSANRNNKGRLGNPEAEIWIGSAATVAASAVTGHITDPREIAGGTWREV